MHAAARRSQDRFIDATRSAHIRLLLVSVPRLLIDGLVALAARREIDVVGEPKPGESVLEAVARTQADVIVVELDQSRLSPCVRSYLDSAAPLRVVTLTDDARQGAYYDLYATPIESVSGESLLAAVEGVS